MAKKKEKVGEVKETTQEVQENSEQVVENGNIYHLIKGKEDSDFLVDIEEQRKKVIKTYNNTRMRNNIIMGVVVVAFIGSFILIAQGQWGQIAGWTIVGLSIVGMVVYYAITNKIYPKQSKDYCYDFWRKSNDYLFNQEHFSECYLDLAEKYDMSSVIADRVYENIIDIASRNVVHGKYKGKEFKFGELAFYKEGAKKRQKDVVFVGRHLEIANNFKIDGRILINLKAEKTFDLPTDLSDLVVLKEEENFVVYGAEGVDYEKILGKELIDALKGIEIRDPLVNINIVFWHKRTAMYLSYDDSIVAIPFQSELKVDSYVSFKKNIGVLFDILMK